MSGMRLMRRRVVSVMATVCAGLAIAASAGAFDNNNPFTVPDGACTVVNSIPCAPTPPGQASNYATSSIVVTGNPGNPPDITVRLKGVVQPTFNPFDNLDIVLVKSGGGQVILTSDAALGCSVCDPPGGSIVFNDVGVPIPQSGDIGSGPYHPTNYIQQDPIFPQAGCTGEPADNWPAPGPGILPPTTSTSLISTFGSSPGNGTWNLYVVDDCKLRNTTSGPWSFTGWSITFSGPTGVKVASLAASAARGRVTVSWQTVQETNMLGFNVYRNAGSKRVKLNAKLIRAKASGRAAGSAYKVVDRKAKGGVSYIYRLQVVELDGTRLWAGSTSMRAR